VLTAAKQQLGLKLSSGRSVIKAQTSASSIHTRNAFRYRDKATRAKFFCEAKQRKSKLLKSAKPKADCESNEAVACCCCWFVVVVSKSVGSLCGFA